MIRQRCQDVLEDCHDKVRLLLRHSNSPVLACATDPRGGPYMRADTELAQHVVVIAVFIDLPATLQDDTSMLMRLAEGPPSSLWSKIDTSSVEMRMSAWTG